MRLVVASACWVAGVYLGLQLDAPASALALFLLASVTLVPLFAIRRWSVLLPVALALLLLGALRSELPLPPGEGLKPYYGLDDVVVEGIVAEDPEVRGGTVRFRFAVDTVTSGDRRQKVRGDLLVTVTPPAQLTGERQAPHIRYGDRLALRGKLDEVPVLEDFDYREYLARQGIAALMSRPEATLLDEGLGNPFLSAVYRLRNSLSRSLNRSLRRAPGLPCPGVASGEAW